MENRLPSSKYLVLLLILLLSSTVSAQNLHALQALVSRRVPALQNKVVFEVMKDESKETAVYYTQGQKLFIKASTTLAAAYALNNYLKKYCNSSFSHTGDHVQIPDTLPQTKKEVSVTAEYPIRYALNYCTYNYTMSFWGWKEWEKELDWMALNGVNLMLAPIGTEEVWQKTLKEFGFSDEEIRKYIPGPAFNAWWLMGNLEGWGGPVSDSMIQHWTSLQQKMLIRMKELGIKPVMQGFTGVVPVALKKHYPQAKIIDQGMWAGGFQRPAVLVPQDSLFAKIATVYYKHLKALYGKEIKYLGGDLFHEGGNSGGLNQEEVSRLVQANMQEHLPKSTWVLQGWQANPSSELLKGLDKSKTLILDLMGDQSENWNQRNGYDQFPWVWCTITNFGGKQGLEGKLMRVLTEPKRAVQQQTGKTMKGVGIIPEGIENNAIIYQWILDGAWQKQVPLIKDNLNIYIKSRYGKTNANLNEAWQYLLQSAYLTNTNGYQGAYESILCARPDTNLIQSVSSWGPTELFYDQELLVQGALQFSKAADQFSNVPTYQFDLVDIWRQVISLKSRKVYLGLMAAYKQKDIVAFQHKKEQFIELLQLQNKWTGTIPAFRVGTWIDQAKNMGTTAADKKLAEWNARTQITYWGADNPGTNLHEYAYKEWNGILTDLYLQRWLKFFDYAEAKINGKEAAYPDFFAMEKQWAEATNTYSAQPEGDCIKMVPELIQKFSGLQ